MKRLLEIALLAGALARPFAGAPALAGDFAVVLVDDQRAEWAGIAPVHIDPTGDQGSAPIDLGAIYLANDDDYVYALIQVGALVNLQSLSQPLRLHFDTDQNSATGYAVSGIGSDLLIEFSGFGTGAEVYEQTAAEFYATELGHGAVGFYHGPTVADTDFELRIERAAHLPQHGHFAFPGAGFDWVARALQPNGQAGDVVPNSGAASYTFATGNQPPPPDNDLAKVNPDHVRLLSYNTLQGSLFGSQSPRWTRILQALNPDVVAFQELWDYSTSQVVARMNADLPLGGGQSWQGFKGNRGQITVSRYPLTHDAGGPWDELCTTIDLPDASHASDLYVINSHFKCCGSIGSSEDAERQAAADATIAWIRDLQTPGGTTLPDDTPIVQMGDLNLVGGPQPLVTLMTGDIQDEGSYGADHPPDWDGTGNERARPIHTDAVASYTWRRDSSSFAPGKLDYIIMTDSAVEVGNHFVLNTLDMTAAKLQALGLEADDTLWASDHMPVVADITPVGATAITPAGAPPVTLTLSIAPNPSARTTHIHFDTPARTRVRLAIYNLHGQLVRRLVDARVHAGRSSIAWDGRDVTARPVPAGHYFVRLEWPGGQAVRKLSLTR